MSSAAAGPAGPPAGPPVGPSAANNRGSRELRALGVGEHSTAGRVSAVTERL